MIRVKFGDAFFLFFTKTSKLFERVIYDIATSLIIGFINTCHLKL